jgi:flagellar biosynthesis anti-sigma factor FlgM
MPVIDSSAGGSLSIFRPDAADAAGGTTMKITRRPLHGPTDLGAALPTVDSDGAESASRTGGRDRVELSAGARLRLRLRQEIGDPTAVDEGRVAELRAQIAEGRYAPDARAIAARLLGELGADALAG